MANAQVIEVKLTDLSHFAVKDSKTGERANVREAFPKLAKLYSTFGYDPEYEKDPHMEGEGEDKKAVRFNAINSIKQIALGDDLEAQEALFKNIYTKGHAAGGSILETAQSIADDEQLVPGRVIQEKNKFYLLGGNTRYVSLLFLHMVNQPSFRENLEVILDDLHGGEGGHVNSPWHLDAWTCDPTTLKFKCTKGSEADLESATVENLIRSKADPMTISNHLAKLEERGSTKYEIADRYFPTAGKTGKDNNKGYLQVLRYLNLQELSSETQRQLREGEIGIEAALKTIGKSSREAQGGFAFRGSPKTVWNCFHWIYSVNGTDFDDLASAKAKAEEMSTEEKPVTYKTRLGEPKEDKFKELLTKEVVDEIGLDKLGMVFRAFTYDKAQEPPKPKKKKEAQKTKAEIEAENAELQKKIAELQAAAS